MNRILAEVVLDGAVGSYDKRYSYYVQSNLPSTQLIGCRVTVPFGKGNIKKQGLIIGIKNTEEDNPKIKSILSITDSTPVLNDEMIKLCVYMKEHLFCTYFDAIHTILPTGLSYRLEEFLTINEEFSLYSGLSENERYVFDIIKNKESVSVKELNNVCEDISDVIISLKNKQAIISELTPKRKIGDKTSKYVRIIDENGDASGLTKRQEEIAEVVRTAGAISVKELEYFTGVSMSVINILAQKGIVELFDKQEFRMPYRIKSSNSNTDIILNEEQQKAYNYLKAKLDDNTESVSLLYGVTGSGKTQVYMKLVDEAMAQNKGVIVMVPEIALTPQMINLFGSRYGEKIAVFHSALSLGQRLDEYNRVKMGIAKIAVGTRSCVFAPVNDLGLIIIDEEQEHTYKSEKSPRFNAREIAKFRAKYNKSVLVLSSATPSLESYSYALSGRYGLCEINNRYGGATLPEVCVVDMRKEIRDGNRSDISRELAEKIEDRLSNKKQVILLLNRRGHNTHISCPNCGYTAVCDECSVSLTYHSANKRLMCHYCGHSESLPEKCRECGNKFLSFQGTGTQRLEAEVKELFPNSKVLRLDADTTMNKDAFTEKLGAFSKKEYDIMIGTQMVAKGLDFPDVDLVGVIGADSAFYSDDYRGFERTFSLLTQVIGRAGRSGGNGEAVIQTLNAEDNIIYLSANQDYKTFYNEEIMTRKLMKYPPYCDICMVVVTSSEKDLANNIAKEIQKNIISNTENEYSDVKVIILGPVPALVVKVNGKYRYRMIIKCKNNKKFREMLQKSIDIKNKKDVSVFVDINPETLI